MRSVAIIFVRALGAYVIAWNVGTFSVIGVSQLMLASSMRGVFSPVLVIPVAFMVIGALMIAFSKSLAGVLTRGVPETALPALDARELLHLGTALIGLYFVGSAVPSLFAAAWAYYGPDLSAGDRFRDVAERLQRAATFLTQAAGYAITGAVLLWMARPLFGRKAA